MSFLPLMSLQNMITCSGVCLFNPQELVGEVNPETQPLRKKSVGPIFSAPICIANAFFTFFSSKCAFRHFSLKEAA